MGRLRIIAGELRGRRILVPDRSTVRPTGDRAREALFDILGSAVVGARVLDAYAGTGALGFEALSRGAAGVLFVESDRQAVRAIRENAARFGVTDRCRALAGNVLDLLGAPDAPGPFDLVLADPPYALPEIEPLLRLTGARLAGDGTIVVERGTRAGAVERAGEVVLRRSAAYGRCRLDFYGRPEPPPEGRGRLPRLGPPPRAG